MLNNQIFAARFVTKTHTTNLATFQAPQNGPLGSIIGEHVSFLTQVTKQDSNMIDHTTSGLYLFKAFAGMNGELLKLIDQPTTNGAVIEGFGAGNLPQAVVPTIQQLITHHIPVVVVSRSFNGSVAPIYGYEGGAKQLQEIGVILCQNLNGQKALIRMQVGLSAGLHDKALITYLRNQEK